jgi:hypothetical protein
VASKTYHGSLSLFGLDGLLVVVPPCRGRSGMYTSVNACSPQPPSMPALVTLRERMPALRAYAARIPAIV